MKDALPENALFALTAIDKQVLRSVRLSLDAVSEFTKSVINKPSIGEHVRTLEINSEEDPGSVVDAKPRLLGDLVTLIGTLPNIRELIWSATSPDKACIAAISKLQHLTSLSILCDIDGWGDYFDANGRRPYDLTGTEYITDILQTVGSRLKHLDIRGVCIAIFSMKGTTILCLLRLMNHLLWCLRKPRNT